MGAIADTLDSSFVMMEYLIKTYTNEGDVVLDNTMGSGTTGVACVRNNRNFVGMESDKKYFDVCQKRITAELDKGHLLDFF